MDEDRINLWLETNRLLVIRVEDWKSYKAHNLAAAKELVLLRCKNSELEKKLEKLLRKNRRPDDGYKVNPRPMHRNWCGHTDTIWNGESWEEL
jgi:hypothetical protein